MEATSWWLIHEYWTHDGYLRSQSLHYPQCTVQFNYIFSTMALFSISYTNATSRCSPPVPECVSECWIHWNRSLFCFVFVFLKINLIVGLDH